jgi:hypothetical protein
MPGRMWPPVAPVGRCAIGYEVNACAGGPLPLLSPCRSHVSLVSGLRLAFRFLGSRLAHGFAAQFDAMGVVHETIEDAVSESGVADLFVPSGDRNLGRQDGGARLIAFLTDFLGVASFGFLQRGHGARFGP